MTADATRLARLGAVLASPSRARILCTLMGGTAHTNAELARHLRLAPSSVSEHVGVLLDAGLVAVEAQGRHRYVRLAGPATAVLVERLTAVAPEVPAAPVPTVPAALRHARSCYRHLAGRLGVAVLDALRDRAALVDREDRLVPGPGADAVFGRLAIDVRALAGDTRTTVARPCLDWSERRHHLAGPLGEAMLATLLDRRWLRRTATPRALALSPLGRQELTDLLRRELP